MVLDNSISVFQRISIPFDKITGSRAAGQQRVKIRQENTMNTIYILRQSDNLVFNADSETFTFTARRLADVKRRAFRKQFHEDSNLRLEDENGKVVSIKRSGFKWEDKL